MTIHVTASSTSQDDAERARREGSVLWARTKRLLDELDALRPDPAHARDSRTATLEAIVAAAITTKLAVLQNQHRSARTATISDHLIRCGQHVPTPAVIRRVLKQHGLY